MIDRPRIIAPGLLPSVGGIKDPRASVVVTPAPPMRAEQSAQGSLSERLPASFPCFVPLWLPEGPPAHPIDIRPFQVEELMLPGSVVRGNHHRRPRPPAVRPLTVHRERGDDRVTFFPRVLGR